MDRLLRRELPEAGDCGDRSAPRSTRATGSAAAAPAPLRELFWLRTLAGVDCRLLPCDEADDALPANEVPSSESGAGKLAYMIRVQYVHLR